MENLIYDFILNDNWRHMLNLCINAMLQDLPQVIIGSFIGIITGLAIWFQWDTDTRERKVW